MYENYGAALASVATSGLTERLDLVTQHRVMADVHPCAEWLI